MSWQKFIGFFVFLHMHLHVISGIISSASYVCMHVNVLNNMHKIFFNIQRKPCINQFVSYGNIECMNNNKKKKQSTIAFIL